MNWLLYIGGGWIWFTITMILVCNSRPLFVFKDGQWATKQKPSVAEMTVPLLDFFFSICVWIWVCWKFI